MGGARIVENVQVTGVTRTDGAVTGVSTDQGDIECEVVVCAAGMWSRQLGLNAGVDIPLYGAEHMWLVTNKMGIPEDIASLRDPDEQIYFRRDAEEQGRAQHEDHERLRELKHLPHSTVKETVSVPSCSPPSLPAEEAVAVSV